MLTRRHIRIKTFQSIYSHIFSKKEDISIGEKELIFSLGKVYELYSLYLSVFAEIQDFANQKIEDAKNKNRPTEDELNPNLKFVNNRVFEMLNKNIELNNEIKKRKIKWTSEGSFNVIKQIWNNIKTSDEYREYMNSGEDTLHEDKQFLIWVFKNIIITNELLHELLEDQSIFWNDDLDVIISAVTLTLDLIRDDSTEYYKLRPLFKDETDEGFARKLFKQTLINDEESLKFIHKHSQNWDLDRLAKIDLILMSMAITEATKFPSVPLKVSLNEYIEISKYYSTPKSKNFINGILDKIFAELKADGKIVKAGRGLINKSLKP